MRASAARAAHSPAAAAPRRARARRRRPAPGWGCAGGRRGCRAPPCCPAARCAASGGAGHWWTACCGAGCRGQGGDKRRRGKVEVECSGGSCACRQASLSRPPRPGTSPEQRRLEDAPQRERALPLGQAVAAQRGIQPQYGGIGIHIQGGHVRRHLCVWERGGRQDASKCFPVCAGCDAVRASKNRG